MRAQLFVAILPLIVFWVVEELWGLKAALIVGCVTAVLELGWEKWRRGRVSFMTLASNSLVLGLGAVSFWMDSGVAFKLQPCVMELTMAALMLGMRFKGGAPFMVRSFRDAPVLSSPQREALLQQPFFVARIHAMDSRLILFMIFHGLAVGWAAIWGSTRVWILLKGVLFYVLLVVVMAPMYRKPKHGNAAPERL